MRIALTWVDAVALALAKHGGNAHLNRLYDDAPRIYGKKPAASEALIRGTLERHSSDSDIFNHNGKDLFTLPGGKGSGVWALRDLKSTIDDMITVKGQLTLLAQVIMAYPSSMSGGANPVAKLKASNVIEFAQQLLPELSLWKKAD